MTVRGRGPGCRRQRRPGGLGPPGCLFATFLGLRDPRDGIHTRALPLLPLLSVPAIAALSSPSPRNQSFRLRDLDLWKNSPIPSPQTPRRPFGESGKCQGPWRRGQRRAEQLAVYLPPDWLQLPLQAAVSLAWAGWQERGALHRVRGLTRRGASRARLQRSRPGAGLRSPLILQTKRKG